MHSRNIILIKMFTAVAAIVAVYAVLVRVNFKSKKNRVSGSGRNITRFISCREKIPDIHIHVFASDLQSLQKLVKSLDAADYGGATANLTIFGNLSLVHTLGSWRHGEYEFTSPENMHQALRDETMVIIFDDEMEASPLHALWFLMQHCAHPNATGIAGGGQGANSVAGLALAPAVWNAFTGARTNESAEPTTLSVVSYLSRLPNSTILFPLLHATDHTFVRTEWQDPLLVEHEPRLMRSWEPEHASRMWKATMVTF